MKKDFKNKILEQLLTDKSIDQKISILSLLNKYEIIQRDLVEEKIKSDHQGKILIFPIKK